MKHPVIGHLFVYGTLRPGDVRWHLLEPFVVDSGWSDIVSGELFDTGLDYPAAVFGGAGTIHGQCFALLETSLSRALEVLDEVEGVVDGEYSRVAVRTGRSIDAWAYAGGSGLDLTPITSGDWFLHRPPPLVPASQPEICLDLRAQRDKRGKFRATGVRTNVATG